MNRESPLPDPTHPNTQKKKKKKKKKKKRYKGKKHIDQSFACIPVGLKQNME